MPTNADVTAQAQQHLLGNYRQAPIALARGKGCELWDEDGKRYLDLYAGIAVSTLGHGHPKLTAALTEQVGKLLHTTNLVYNAQAARLAERLASKTGGALPRAFFCNSGTEAIEACVKLARRRAFLAGEPNRTRFVAFKNAFHGRTLGALPLTGTPKYWEGFDCDVERVTHVDYGDLERDQGPGVARSSSSRGGGRGGARRRRARDPRLEFEATPSSPRSSRWPRGSGGVPIGAMLVRAELDSVLSPGTHGTTFGGNPLACAAANAIVDRDRGRGRERGAGLERRRVTRRCSPASAARGCSAGS